MPAITIGASAPASRNDRHGSGRAHSRASPDSSRLARDAKLLLESDLRSADQVLEILGVCRTLRTKLPIDAFATPATAEAWLLAQNLRLGARRVHVPERRSQP